VYVIPIQETYIRVFFLPPRLPCQVTEVACIYAGGFPVKSMGFVYEKAESDREGLSSEKKAHAACFKRFVGLKRGGLGSRAPRTRDRLRQVGV